MPSEVILFSGLLLLFAVYLFAAISLFFSPTGIKSIINGAPPVPSSKRGVKLALKSIGLSEGDLFYDLGSGTGRAVIIADKSFGADAHGLEWSLFWVLFSKINLFIHKSDGKIERSNFLKKDFSEADVVYSYTSESLMERLEKNILSEEMELTVVSYCFPFPNLKPEKTIKTAKGKNIFIYKT